MKKLIVPTIFGVAITVSGCVGTDMRPMNLGEGTILSPDVRRLLSESDGSIDIRDHPEVECTRERLVGTHMVTRICYTKTEEEELSRENSEKARARFKSHCLDQNSVACQAGLDG